MDTKDRDVFFISLKESISNIIFYGIGAIVVYSLFFVSESFSLVLFYIYFGIIVIDGLRLVVAGILDILTIIPRYLEFKKRDESISPIFYSIGATLVQFIQITLMFLFWLLLRNIINPEFLISLF